MSLSKYNQKRDFKQTSEPKGTIAKSKSELIFVVQKHAASHLHYDFRLEMNGVLKSWAVPKGPSMDPDVKRLAMMVEDHPYSYKDFEGTIPEGNYGAGNVIVWDNGTYTSDEKTADNEKQVLDDLKKGRLSFILKGKKLKGEFSLVKLHGKQENAWLLIKKQDQYASNDDILEKNKSVISKRTLEELEVKSKKIVSKSSPKETTKTVKKNPNPKSKAAFIKPMLANTFEKTFDNEEWIFENKYDGYRTIAVINPDQIELFSRNKISFTASFKPIADELRKIDHTVVLDGEVVVENDSGQADFQMLQNYLKTGLGHLKYYVFDLLNLDGNLLTELSLLERKELLKILFNKYAFTNIFFSEHIVGNGIKQLEKARKNKSEGIIAKKSNSSYSIGNRSGNWLKIKLSNEEEAIIIGITEPKNSRKYFGAILLGQFKGKELQYIGKCGTGFTEAVLKELYTKLLPYFIEKSPLTEKVPLRDKIQWVKPKLICQVKYSEWTQDKHLRHPVYLGLRVDKKIAEVQLQTNGKNTSDGNEIKNKTLKKDIMEDLKVPKTENDYDVKIGKTTLHLTNQNKIYFPKDGITKGEIVQYYNEVSALILPYLKDRPESMNRFPNGIDAPSFYQKDIDLDKTPKWLKTKKIYSESNDENIDYLICNNKETLLYMANLGCIEMNPWNSTIQHIQNPDWLVMDLDPATKEDFAVVIETAKTVKQLMDELETECLCKTSGATGLHIYIPLGAQYDYDSIKILGELIAREIQSRLPEKTTTERSIKKRNNKLYIDYLQNRKGQTLAAPYSVRPKPGATVSTPLEWSEVSEKLHPSQFTIKNVLKRFEKKGDLWQPVLSKGANIKKIIQKLEERK
ncbi:DNA ligase D [Flavobacterium phragmitis]|uniref:DNA ligase (ATP) n=1 Tax=Flavobacterium phragmitis TaxID=739143 RepID=A0A1I1WWE5_9FLAO|nr:DNA ligase D [Flavobacterium phragmitis]SFD98698.1 ATP-dependent DNA ligase LigD phosphoesterase module /ATP-dependent DNA ligase LigD polymerase module [Flavobacterium phragmitis]